MAISHICLDCGLDLARLHPVREPHYGLALVTCPQCGRAAVRRRHPVARVLRSTVRVDAALTALLFQFLALGAFLSLNVYGAMALGELVARSWRRPDVIGFRLTLIVILGVALPLATGTWLTAGLHHWRRVQAFLAWTMLLFIAVTIVSLLVALTAPFTGSAVGGPGRYSWDVIILNQFAAYWGPALAAAAAMCAVATTGIAPGLGLVWLARQFRRWRWRWRRRRRRAGRFVL